MVFIAISVRVLRVSAVFKSIQTFLLALFFLSNANASTTTNNSDLTVSQQEIVNGTEAKDGEQDWMVALLFKSDDDSDLASDRQFCGGVLIDEFWVLSAAHCLGRVSADEIELAIGAIDLDSDEYETHDVDVISVHPNYDPSAFIHDIALIRLEVASAFEPLALFDNVSESILSDQMVTALGWGRTEIHLDAEPECELQFANSSIDESNYDCKLNRFSSSYPPDQAVLLETSVLVISDDACRTVLTNYFIDNGFNVAFVDDLFGSEITNSKFCVYDEESTSATCQGDSGGPLVHAVNGEEFHVGITSFGISEDPCGQDKISIYTKTAFYLEYIDNVMHQDFSLSFDNFCPGTVVPQVTYTSQTATSSLVEISWEEAANAENYILRYSTYPATGGIIEDVILPSAPNSISAVLDSGLSFYISMQASNTNCSGPASDLVAVIVP